ncbi:MAG: hypothetical protein ACP5OV_03590 [Acidimicrobiales bacterium]
MKKPIVVLAVALMLGLTSTGIGAATGVRPQGPPVILMPAHNYSFDSLAGLAARSCYTAGWTSTACIGVELRVINHIHRLEGVAPMALPTNWAHLSVPEQLFVVTDLERVDRGLPPYLGLNGALSAVAQVGAVRDADPMPPPRLVGYGFGSTWAGGADNALMADFEWMYNDGWGGSRATTSNFDCTSAHSAGCWGHRDVLLGWSPTEHLGTGLDCATCVMGTGYAPGSQTTLIVEPQAAMPLYFTWATDVLPYVTSRPWSRYLNLLVPQFSPDLGSTGVAPSVLRQAGYVSEVRTALNGLGAGPSVFADRVELYYSSYGENYVVGLVAAFASTLRAPVASTAARDACDALSPFSTPTVSRTGVGGSVRATCDQGRLGVVAWVKANVLGMAASYDAVAGMGRVSVGGLESVATASWEIVTASGEPF